MTSTTPDMMGFTRPANVDQTELDAVQAIADQALALARGSGVVKRPEDYGAARDGVTNDTAAIQSALDAAVAACIADGTYWCEVQFSAGTYLLSSATTKGGTTRGNAQIRLPNREPAAGQKVTIVLRGPGDAGAFQHWLQTVPQRSGAVLRSTLASQTPDGTWGSPSVIGGPTATLTGGGEFSNIRVVLDGLTVVAPINPSVIAADLRRCAQADVMTFSALANGIPAEINTPLDSNGIGLYMPMINNNDSANIWRYSCEGFYYALGCADHLVAVSLALVYYNTAIFINAQSATAVHGMSILYLSAEAGATIIEKTNSAGNKYPIFIGRLDTETQTGTAIKDPADNLHGYIGWASNDGADPTVTGCKHVKIENANLNRGTITAPAVPASTVATTPIFRDAMVVVTAGTVTAITVDGVATGLITGSVIVPAGKSIALTYTVAPTWKWWLL